MKRSLSLNREQLSFITTQELIMTEDKRINKLYLKIAGLERRISKIELGLEEHDKVIDPQGWIGEAFERVYEDIDRLENKLDNLDRTVNSKLDTILKHITGLNN